MSSSDRYTQDEEDDGHYTQDAQDENDDSVGNVLGELEDEPPMAHQPMITPDVSPIEGNAEIYASPVAILEEPVMEAPEITDFTSMETLKKVMKWYKQSPNPTYSYAELHPSFKEPMNVDLPSKKQALSTIITLLNTNPNFSNMLLNEHVNFKMDSGVDMGGVKREIYTHLANEMSRFTKLDISKYLELTPETPCDEVKLKIVNDFKQLIQDINVRELIQLHYKTDKVYDILEDILNPVIEDHLNELFQKAGVIIIRETFTDLLEVLHSSKNLGYTTNITMKQLFAFLHKKADGSTEYYNFTKHILPNLFKLICIAIFEMTEEHTDYFLSLPNAKKAVIWMYISALDDANYVANFKQQYVADSGKAFYFGRMGLPETIRPPESEEDEDDITVFEQYEEYAEKYEYNGLLNMDELIDAVYDTNDFIYLYYTLNPETEINAEQIENFITNNLKYDVFTTNYVPYDYIPFQEATKTLITNMVRDYTTGLSEEMKEEVQKTFPTQDAFLKRLLFFWTGSPIINQGKTYSITNRNSQFIVSHTCFYWLELNETVIEDKSQDEFISMVVATIGGEGGFNMAGGRRRRFKKTQRNKKSIKKGRFKKSLKRRL